MSTDTLSRPRPVEEGPSAPHSRRSTALLAARELLVLAIGFQLYRWARLLTAQDVGRAFDNATEVLHLEQLLRLPSELTLQAWTLGSDVVVQAANTYYATVHFPATAVAMVWLFLRRRPDYGWFRSSIVTLTAAGLVVHLLVPLAPPRMMPGFVDTGRLFGQSVYEGSLGAAANQIAAMPSLHVGWALLVAVGVLATVRSRWRWLVVLHPGVTVVVVVVTGNHYWLDALIAAALLTAALSLYAPRPLHRLPWLARDRASAADARSAADETPGPGDCDPRPEQERPGRDGGAERDPRPVRCR